MNKTQAKTTPTELDQVELMKQFIETWKGEFGENSGETIITNPSDDPFRF